MRPPFPPGSTAFNTCVQTSFEYQSITRILQVRGNERGFHVS